MHTIWKSTFKRLKTCRKHRHLVTKGKEKELSSSQEKYAIDHHITLLLPVHQSKKKSNATPSSGSTLGTNTLRKRKQGKSRTCTYDKHAFLYIA